MTRHVTTILLGILAVGALLRLVGVWHGLPFPLRSDEESLIGGALRMLELRSLIPAFHPEAMSILNYPPGLPYLFLVLFAPYLGVLYLTSGLPAFGEFSLTVFDHMGAIFSLARLTSVAFSLGVVFVVYRLGREIFKTPVAGLFAAALIAVDFVSTFTAHFARHWNLTTLIVWLTVLVSWRIFEHQRRRDYLLLGFLSGFGFGVSYSFGCLGLAAGLVAHLAAKGPRRLFDRDIVVSGVIFVGMALLFFLLHPNAVLRLVVGEVAGLDEGKSLLGWLQAVAYYTRALWFENPAILVIGVIGVIYALWNRRFTPVAMAIGTFLFLMTVLYTTVTLEGRYIILVVPLFALIGGFGIDHVLQASRLVPVLRAVAVAGVVGGLALPLAVSAKASWMLAKDDTRVLALDWIGANIEGGSKIIVDLAGVRLNSTLESLAAQGNIDPTTLTAAERALLRNREAAAVRARDRGPAYHTLHLFRFADSARARVHAADSFSAYREQGYRYFVGQYRDDGDITPLFQVAREQGRLLARFVATEGGIQPPYLRSTVLLTYPMHHLFDMDRFGPTVEILEIPERDE